MAPVNRRRFLNRFALLLAVGSLDSLAGDRMYVVRKGDTLSHIAQRFGTTVEKLKRANHLQVDMIRIGQRLAIPERTEYLALVRQKTQLLRLERNKWKYIVAHHSATPHGNAKSYDRAHRRHGMKNGLAYHFVIGNGRDSGDGEIEIGARWIHQANGGHVSKSEYNNHGIGICLVGNFEKTKPTTKQLVAFKELVGFLGQNVLQGRYDFLVHKEINATLCPGRHFPTQAMHKLFG